MNYNFFGLFFSLLVLMLAQWSTAQARIAFITPDGQLATINSDGTSFHLLSESGKSYQFPAWSPDGSKLAAIGSDSTGGFLQVFYDDDKSSPKELYHSRTEGPFYMYWAPNSQTIAFLANNPGGGLALRTVSEQSPAQILAFGAPFYWQWTKDSQNLFIHTGFNSQQARLGFTSRVRDTLLDNLAAAGRFQAPGISASAEYIAYAVEDLRGSRIVLQNNPTLNSSEVLRELPHAGIAALTWNPVRDQLAIMSPAQNSPSYFGIISLLDAETGLLEPLSKQAAFAFFWSPDGRYIAYFAPAQGGGEFAGSGQQQISQKVQSTALSLNLIDTESKTDQHVADFFASPLFLNQFLPFFDQYALSHNFWSPASDALVLPIVFERRLHIAVFSLTGEVSVIAEGDAPFWNKP